ncbi:MAG: DUF2341 domain-containing protein [Nitrososphaeria archaeon]
MKMRVLILTVFSLLLIAYAPPYTHYVAAQPVYYVPINLYSSSGIRGSYQLNVTFDPSLYKSYLSPDLGNIRFMFSNGTMLHAWLESYSGTSPLNSQSALIWVNLPDGVPRGNTVIYMVFEHNQTFDGYWMGEAPQLSPKYGEYDNGMYVFDYYTNFMNNRSLDVWDLNGTLPGFAVFNDGMWLNAGLVNGYQFTMKKSYTGNYTVDAFEWVANASVNSQYHMGSDNVYPGISFNQLRTSNYTLIPPGNSGGVQEALTAFPTFTEYLSTTNATSNGFPPPLIQTAIPITSPAVFTIGFSGSTVFSQINYSYTISYKNSNTAGPNFPGLLTLALAQTSEDWIHVFWFRVRTTPSSAVRVSISKTPKPMLVGLTITSESGGSVSYFWSGGNGTVQPSQTATIYVAYGSQVKLYAHPNSGWAFASWNGSGSGSYSGTNNPITVQVNNSMTETANYNVALTISANGLKSSAQGTIVTVNGNPYTYSQLPVTVYISPGSTVSYSFNSSIPGISGQRFVWSSTGGIDNAQSGLFTMPATPQTLTGNYQEQYYLSVVSPNNLGNPQGYGWYDAGMIVNFSVMTPVSTGPGQRYVFVSWTGTGPGSYSGTNNPATVKMNGPITEMANWQLQYYLTMQVKPKGAGTVSPSSGWYDAGEQITIWALAKSGYKFMSWSGSGKGSYSGSNNTATITMNSPVNETANFDIGITFSASGLNSNAQGTVLTVNGQSYTYSQLPVTIYASPGSSISFSWISPVSGGTGTQFVWTSTSGLRTSQSGTITVSSPGSVTASYKEQFYLTINANPSSGGSVSPGSGWYNAGTQVQISATANSGYQFASWSGSGSGSYTGTNNPATITMNSPITETANYNVALTISANGLESSAQGTIVTVNGNPYTYSQLPVTLYIAPGSTVTYSWNSPVPSGTGVRFVWASTSGQATGETGSFSMPSSPVALTGSYQKQYYLNMSVYPEGSASVSPSSGWYDSGSLVNISSCANPGYEFVFWKGEGNGSYTGPYVKSRVIMDSPITEISVSYVEVSISSTPGGYIYFYYDGTSFKVQNFTTYLPYMASVSLSPAAYPGYYFSGWNLSPVNGTFVLLYPSSFKAVFLKYNVINFSVISSSSSLLNAYGELVDQQGNIIIINSGEQTQVKPGLYFLVISQDQFNQTPYKFYFGSQNLSEFSQITMVNITGNGKSYRLLAVDPVKTSISVHVVSLYDREVYLTVSLINQITNAPIPYQVVQITLWSEYGNYSVSVNTGPQGRVSIDIPYVHGGTYSWRAYYSGNSSIGTDPCASSSSLKTSLFSSKVKINENGLPKGTSWSGSIGGYSFVSSQGSVILNVDSGRYSLGINPVFTQQIEYVPSAYPSFINAFGSVSINVNYSVYFYVYITSGNIHGGTVSMYGTYWFPNGSKITLSADPNAGYRFSGWVTTGSSIKISNYSAEETTVTINGPGVIIAEFEPES